MDDVVDVIPAISVAVVVVPLLVVVLVLQSLDGVPRILSSKSASDPYSSK